MIIEKTVIEGNRYNVDLNDYVAEGELTVTITLSEYRDLTSSRSLLKTSREKSMKAGLSSIREPMMPRRE